MRSWLFLVLLLVFYIFVALRCVVVVGWLVGSSCSTLEARLGVGLMRTLCADFVFVYCFRCLFVLMVALHSSIATRFSGSSPHLIAWPPHTYICTPHWSSVVGLRRPPPPLRIFNILMQSDGRPHSPSYELHIHTRGNSHSTGRTDVTASILGRTRTAEQRGGEPYTAHDDARGADRDVEEESAEIGAFLVFYVDELFVLCLRG